MSDVLELVDGQTYRWAWKDTSGWGQSDPYWCKSRLAVVKNGKLYDTFWSSPSYEHTVDPAKVDLTLLCDDTWTVIPNGKQQYYDPEDVVDTRHSNHSGAPIYLRPGAQKSKAAILETLAAREEEANRKIRSAEWDKERVNEARKLLAEGRLDEVWL